jgi:hypothetical protein
VAQKSWASFRTFSGSTTNASQNRSSLPSTPRRERIKNLPNRKSASETNGSPHKSVLPKRPASLAGSHASPNGLEPKIVPKLEPGSSQRGVPQTLPTWAKDQIRRASYERIHAQKNTAEEPIELSDSD